MEEFEAELNRHISDLILSIHSFMNGVNVYFLENVIGCFHRKLITHSFYVNWVVLKLLLFKWDYLTSGKFCKLIEDNKYQITPTHILGYYRHELQYELKRNNSVIAKKINTLHLEQHNLNKFIEDYLANSDKYNKLQMVLDKPELFRYIEDFLRI